MYSMSHQVATVGAIGRLAPTCIQYVNPGDTWSGKCGQLIRLSPLKRALLTDLFVDNFFFYVPYRLIWADWENFIADGPMDVPNHSPPTEAVGVDSTSLSCLFLAGGETAITYSAMSEYAYNLIWNEYFRDDNDPTRVPSQAPGQFGAEVYYKKDYWTCLREQLGHGQSDQLIPLDATAENISATEILRGLAQQKIAMKRATYGTRYVDILRSFGISVNYQMLQRPEVCAMSRGTVNVTDVVQTTDGAGPDNELGELGGHGISGNRLSLRRKTFPEHGILMGLAVVRPVHLDKLYNEWLENRGRTYQDYYDPGLVPLPPVAVEKGDVAPVLQSLDDIIGYQPWGEWYRKAMSRVHMNLDDEWVPGAAGDLTDININDLRKIDADQYDSLFQTPVEPFGHFQISQVNHLRALRLIPRTNTMLNTGFPG